MNDYNENVENHEIFDVFLRFEKINVFHLTLFCVKFSRFFFFFIKRSIEKIHKFFDEKFFNCNNNYFQSLTSTSSKKCEQIFIRRRSKSFITQFYFQKKHKKNSKFTKSNKNEHVSIRNIIYQKHFEKNHFQHVNNINEIFHISLQQMCKNKTIE